MQAVILALYDSCHLRQVTVNGVVGTLPLGGSRGTVLSDLVETFIAVGIPDPIILCRPKKSKAIKQCLPKPSECKVIEVSPKFTVPECLSRIRDQFRGHPNGRYVFVTYADLVVTELDLRSLFRRLVRTNAEVVALASPYSTDAKFLKNSRGTNDLMFISAKDESLAMYTPASEIKSQARIPSAIMEAHGQLNARADLHDAGLYLLTDYALRFLEFHKESVGWKKSFFRHLVNQVQYEKPLSDPNPGASELTRLLDELLEKEPKSLKVVVCVNDSGLLCRRMDSPLSYLDAVKTGVEHGCRSGHGDLRSGPVIADSTVAQDAEVTGAGVNIRCCYLGPGCSVRSDTRLLASVLLSKVTVGTGCNIISCLVGEGARIDDGCDLRECVIGAGQHILAKTEAQGQNMGISEMDSDELLQ